MSAKDHDQAPHQLKDGFSIKQSCPSLRDDDFGAGSYSWRRGCTRKTHTDKIRQARFLLVSRKQSANLDSTSRLCIFGRSLPANVRHCMRAGLRTAYVDRCCRHVPGCCILQPRCGTYCLVQVQSVQHSRCGACRFSYTQSSSQIHNAINRSLQPRQRNLPIPNHCSLLILHATLHAQVKNDPLLVLTSRVREAWLG